MILKDMNLLMISDENFDEVSEEFKHIKSS
jgi:hypothetical protein